MGKQAFTPGPWTVEVSQNLSHTVRVVCNSDGEFGDDVCLVGDVTKGNSAADAALIAAAPEGYALAEAIERLASSPLQHDYVPAEIQALAKTFLAKARGVAV